MYEFTETKHAYVGRSYQPKTRDVNHRHGKITHSDGRVYYDTVYKYSVDSGIEIPKMKILEENLDARESQEKEREWIKTYSDNGWTMLNKVKGGSLGARQMIWDYDACLQESKKYENKNQFRINSGGAYRSSYVNGWLDDFYENAKADNGTFDKYETVLEEARKYKNLSDLRKNYSFLYIKICEHDWNDRIFKDLKWGKYREEKRPIFERGTISDEFKPIDIVAEGYTEIDIMMSSDFLFSLYNAMLTSGISRNDIKFIEKDSDETGSILFVCDKARLIVFANDVCSFGEEINGRKHMDILNRTLYFNDRGYKTINVFNDEFVRFDEGRDDFNEYYRYIKENLFEGRNLSSSYTLSDVKYTELLDIANEVNFMRFETPRHCVVIRDNVNDIDDKLENKVVGIFMFRANKQSGEIMLSNYYADVRRSLPQMLEISLRYVSEKYGIESVSYNGIRDRIGNINCNAFTKGGFALVKVYRPEFKYFKINDGERINKLNIEKVKQKYGGTYDKIWTSGLIRYTWKKNENETPQYPTKPEAEQ